MPVEQILVQLNPDVPPSGSDLAVVNAARRSFGKRSQLTPEGSLLYSDVRLIEYLARGYTSGDWEGLVSEVEGEGNRDQLKKLLWGWRNNPTHDTPFNHCHISFEVKAPIFVARHLVKTEYAPFSEFSRRYITDDVEFYIHDYRETSPDKKQGSGGLHKRSARWSACVSSNNSYQLKLYKDMIEDGVAPEQARGILPTDLMTSWTWSATLGAFAKMCRERLGSDVQVETRYVAEQVYKHLQTYFPISAKALVEGAY